jgi:UDP-N-acetylglucosamine/UDP-N-acetylgalactosamine diphosphorylase
MNTARWNELKQFGQEHLLRHLETLPPDARERLEAQLARIDFAQLSKLHAGHEAGPDWQALAEEAQPPAAVRLDPPPPEHEAAAAVQQGAAALRSGQVAVLLVAGGQGSRLGFNLPKGMFPIGPVSGRSLFQMHADRVLALGRKYGREIPLYIMTSPATDADTRDYFEREHLCGLSRSQLRFFCQGQMPAVDAASGRVLLSAPDELALSPDGHGGIVAALASSGLLEEARELGVEHFFYAQVDNPLVELGDPALIGYHRRAGSQLTTQVVKKRFAKEKVGNVVSIGGRAMIIEYSDLPDSAAERRDAQGELLLWAGNIAVHIFDRDFLEQVQNAADGLPFHRAHKAVAYIDERGQLVQPQQPNAIKFERFVFDLLPLAERTLVVEGDAARVFAPVKNADGAAVDTPSSAKAALCALHRSWLEAAGARVDEEVAVEIHPGWALDAGEAKEKITPPLHIRTDTFLM